MSEPTSLVERLKAFARDYTGTEFHEDLVLEVAAEIEALSVDARKWREQVKLNDLAIACELRCEGG